EASAVGAAARGTVARSAILGSSLPELTRALLCAESLDERVDVTSEHGLQRKLIDLLLHPVIGHTVLRKVVGADPLGAVTAPDLRSALGGLLRASLLLRHLEQARAQVAHRLLPVLELRALLLCRDDDARRLVRDPDRRVRGVHRLSPRP